MPFLTKEKKKKSKGILDIENDSVIGEGEQAGF